MKKNLKKNINLHSLLMKCIDKKNNEILNFLITEEIDSVVSSIDEREHMIKLVNKIQKNIERIITDINGYCYEDIKRWHESVTIWINKCHQYDEKIILKLSLLKKSIKKKIISTHIGRMKFQGYNLNNLSK